MWRSDTRDAPVQSSGEMRFPSGALPRPASQVLSDRASYIVVCLLLSLVGCEGTKSTPSVTSPSSNSSVKNAGSTPFKTSDPKHFPQSVPVAAVQSTDWFEDVTASSGVHFTYRNGREAKQFYMIESFGGGVGAVDFDRDGDMDLFITGGGTISQAAPHSIEGLPPALFRNQGGFQLVDATVSSRLTEPTDYSQGCAVTDFDVDGFFDLFVCCYGQNRLYHNQGDGTYREVRNAVPGGTWSTAATFADVDVDGLPDLCVARYADWTPEIDVKCDGKGVRDLCGPTSYPPTSCQVFRNCGDGTFADWSRRVGMHGNVHGLAVVATDLNLDGRVDLYVASDVTPNQLYLGGDTFPLQERGQPAGVALNEWGQPEGSMGVDVADYDGDGKPDIIVTNFELEDNSLYRNEGGGVFMHATVAAGLSGVSRMRVGFGTALADFNNDSWPDLFVLNGNPIYEVAETPFRQHSQLFRNVGGRFEDISEQGGTFFRQSYSGRGNAAVDLNEDGLLDLVVIPMNEPVVVLRNRNPNSNFIRVHLRSLEGEPDAIGARVSVTLSGRRVVQFVVRGTGFFSQSDPRMIFPVAPSESAIDVTVHWPGRASEIFSNLPVRETHVLIEGHGSRHHE